MATNFRVLTFNVKMFSDLMKTGAGGAGVPPRMFYEAQITDEQRTKRIADAIVAGGYDVVCLQELFDEARRAQFAEAFTRAGYWVIRKASDGDLVHEDSGLFVASRHRMHERWFFNEYDASTGFDAFADKGILGCWIFLDKQKYGCKNLNLFNTHLQADAENGAVRAGQLRQARRFAARYLRKAPHSDTVALLLGDLNVIEETGEYKRMLDNLRTARDALRTKYALSERPSYTWDAPSNRNMIASTSVAMERLDYILAFRQVPPEDRNVPTPALHPVEVVDAGVQEFDTTENTRLSDHYALEATLSFA
jgi:endonuclease/exonuclease/phosphatase family metal-dependent hydrolase